MNAYLPTRIATTSPTLVLRAIARFGDVSPADIKGQSRDWHVTSLRFIAAHVLRYHSGLSTTATARALGGRHHTTILNACERLPARLRASRRAWWVYCQAVDAFGARVRVADHDAIAAQYA